MYMYYIWGNIHPPFYFRACCQRANWRLGEFRCLQLYLFQHNCVWANSRWDNTVCKRKRAKIIRDENNPVHSYALLCKVHTGVSCSSNEAEPITLILTGCIQTDDGVLDNHLQHIYWDNEHCLKYRKLKKLSIRSLTSNSKIINCWTTFNKNKESSLNSCVVFLASNGP